MNNFQNRSSRLRLLPIVACALAVFLVISATLPPPIQAQRPRPRQRTVSWIKGSKGRHRTALYGGKGAENCISPDLQTATEYRRKFEGLQAIRLERPEHFNIIEIRPCWSDSSVSPGDAQFNYSLTGPQDQDFNGTDLGDDGFRFELNTFEPAGIYSLTVTTGFGSYPPAFQVNMKSLPRMGVFNPNTKESSIMYPGQSLDLQYWGFVAGKRIDVELWSPQGFLAADSWQFTSDEDGKYAESIVLPFDILSGIYLITACPEDCPMDFLGQEGVSLPDMVFSLVDVGPQPLAYSFNISSNPDIAVLDDFNSNRDRKLDALSPLSRTTRHFEDEPDLGWKIGVGTVLAFQRKTDNSYGIWLLDALEGTRLLTADDGDEWEPDWSPDAGSILYRAGGDRYGQGELRVVDPVTGEDQQFANKMILGHAPTWSPDGNRVAYDAKRPGSKAFQVFVFDRDTGQERQLTNCQTNCRFPNWSPDGTYLAYHSTLGFMDQTPQIIWKVRADGAEAPQSIARGQEPGRPVWTQGGAIIFESRNGLEIITADGNNRTLIPETAGAHAPDTPLPRFLASQEESGSTPTVSQDDSPDNGFIVGDSDGFIVDDSDEQRTEPVEGAPSTETDLPTSDYFGLAWVPECDPLRAELALLLPGQSACDEGVKTWSLEVVAETLTGHLLLDGEKLLPVHLDGKANQRIGIFDHEGTQTGWLRLDERKMWRSDYGSDVEYSGECQLSTDNLWDCAKG